MKEMKRIVVVVLMLVVGTGAVNAQEQVESLIKNSPFHFIGNTFHMSYEKMISADKSLNFSGGFHLSGYNWDNDTELGDVATTYQDRNAEIGWSGELQLRKYLFNFKNSIAALNGVYVAPYVKGSYFSEDYSYDNGYYSGGYYDDDVVWVSEVYAENIVGVDRDVKSIQAGVIMGVQYLFSDVLALELFLGGGIQCAETSGAGDYYDNDIWDRGYTGVIPKIGFNIGVAF